MDKAKLFVGFFIAGVGLLIMIVDGIHPLYADDDGKERTFTQASIWLVGGFIIAFG